LALAIKSPLQLFPVYAFFKLNPIAIANIFSQCQDNISYLGVKVVNISLLARGREPSGEGKPGGRIISIRDKSHFAGRLFSYICLPFQVTS
jgi:hypothetical protein